MADTLYTTTPISAVTPAPAAGQIVILNGAPRTGKTSIAHAIQARAQGVWVNLGVDASVGATPARFLPGLGLRPGGERPDLEDLVVTLAEALFGSIACHARLGLNVVADLGLHDAYTSPLHLRALGAQWLDGLPVLFVGVHCSLDVVWERRAATWGQRKEEASEELLRAVERWQAAVHVGHGYDLAVDTAVHTPDAGAALVLARLAEGPAGSGLWDRVVR